MVLLFVILVLESNVNAGIADSGTTLVVSTEMNFLFGSPVCAAADCATGVTGDGDEELDRPDILYQKKFSIFIFINVARTV
jgi:hypothetical protein